MTLRFLARRLAVILGATAWLSACGGGGGGGDTSASVNPQPTLPTPTTNAPSNEAPVPAPEPAPVPAPVPAPIEPVRAPIPTDVGTTIGQQVSKVIGPAGGELSSSDGAITVTVPAGAFADDKTVTIQEITNEAHGAKGRAFRIGPEGLDTPVPMTVRFHYTQETLRGTTLAALSIAYQDATRVWHSYSRPSVNTNAMTLSVPTKHFSDWSLVTGVQITPNTARVKVGQGLALKVVVCEYAAEDEFGDLFIPLPNTLIGCEDSPLNSFSTDTWSVNAVEGGSSTFGTVVPDADRWTGKATYTAPATKPTQNVVAVSARHQLIDQPQTLVANVTIDEEASSCEGFGSIEQFDAELSFDQFAFVATAEHRRHNGKHAGRLLGTLKKAVSTPGFGFWTTYQSPLKGGEVSIDDSYVYQPPSGDGYSGTIDGNGPPHDDIRLPSFIALKVNYAECTFDLFGSFIVDGTVVHNGSLTNQSIGIGGVYLFGNAIRPEQASGTALEGSRGITANYDTETTGYIPLEETMTLWTVSGSTTARWRISPQ
jgi:hypothetical protein